MDFRGDIYATLTHQNTSIFFLYRFYNYMFVLCTVYSRYSDQSLSQMPLKYVLIDARDFMHFPIFKNILLTKSCLYNFKINIRIVLSYISCAKFVSEKPPSYCFNLISYMNCSFGIYLNIVTKKYRYTDDFALLLKNCLFSIKHIVKK